MRLHWDYIYIFSAICPALTIANGFTNYNTYPSNNKKYPENTLANLGCHGGYIFSGSSSRTCQGSGNWNGQTTTCSGNYIKRLW